MTGSYSMQSSVARCTCGSHFKSREIKFLYIVEPMDFYELPTYNGAGWLELRN